MFVRAEKANASKGAKLACPIKEGRESEWVIGYPSYASTPFMKKAGLQLFLNVELKGKGPRV